MKPLRWIHWTIRRLTALVRRDAVDRDMDDEMRAHVEMETEDLVRQGLSRDDARRRALIGFGSVDRFKEEGRDARATMWLDQLWHDVRFSTRSLRRTPGFTAAALVTLGLGIGSTTAVFSVVEGLLLRSLPYPDSERLMSVWTLREAAWRPDATGGNTSTLNAFHVWREARHVFDDAATTTGGAPVLHGFGPPERIQSSAASASLFTLLGTTAFIGRTFVTEEDSPGAPPVAVLDHTFWRTRLGSDTNVIGRGITLDTTTFTVVGVLPPDFSYTPHSAVWRNLGAALTGPGGAARARRRSFWVHGRLAPGVTVADARANLDAVTRAAWPTDRELDGWLPVIVPLHDYHVQDVRTPLLMVLGAVTLVFLIACANVAGSLTARLVTRGPEIALRSALGAGRYRLVRHVMSESLLLALSGGVIGVLAATWAVPRLVALGRHELPDIAEISVNWLVLATALALSVLAGLIAGLVPAFRAMRAAPMHALKAAPTGRTAAILPVVDTLITGQIALTVILLSGSGLLLRSFLGLVRADPGFDPRGVAVAWLSLPAVKFPDSGQRVAYAQAVLAEVRALPGVTSATIANSVPLDGSSIGTVSVPGRTQDEDQSAWFSAVEPDFFTLLRIPLLQGRLLEARENDAIVINAAAARAYFRAEDPIGRQLTYYGSWTRTVVGVVGDARQRSLHQPVDPHIYHPYSSEATSYIKVLARSNDDPASLTRALRTTIQTVDPTVPIDRIDAMTTLMGQAIARQRFYAVLLVIFGAAALVVAASGVYGIASYAVSRRTREIGVRVVLGATGPDLYRLILGRSALFGLAGLTVGLLAALATSRVLTGLLFDLRPDNPGVLLAVTAILVLALFLAGWAPAHRATRVDPVRALRHE